MSPKMKWYRRRRYIFLLAIVASIIATVVYYRGPIQEYLGSDSVKQKIGLVGAAIIFGLSIFFDLPWLRESLMKVVEVAVNRSPEQKRDADIIVEAVASEFIAAKCNAFDLSVTLGLVSLLELKIADAEDKKETSEKPNQSADGATMDLFARYAVYAGAVYGNPEIEGSGTKTDDSDGTKPQALTENQRQQMHDDWIKKRLSDLSGEIQPCPYVDSEKVKGKPMLEHFVAVDHLQKAVVLVLKGTQGLPDIVKNAKAEYVDREYWKAKYKVHGGMVLAAEDLVKYADLKKQLTTLLEQNPLYGLVITGHSLGGGVAALVTVLLASCECVPGEPDKFLTNDKTIPGRTITCFAISSAASIDQNLAKKTKHIMNSIVVGYDIVPSLCIGILKDLFVAAAVVKGDYFFLAELIQDLLPWGEQMSEKRAAVHLKKLRPAERNERLVPPGRVWAAVTRDVKIGAIEIGEIADVYTRFGSLRMARSVMDDHAIDRSTNLLQELCKKNRARSSA